MISDFSQILAPTSKFAEKRIGYRPVVSYYFSRNRRVKVLIAVVSPIFKRFDEKQHIFQCPNCRMNQLGRPKLMHWNGNEAGASLREHFVPRDRFTQNYRRMLSIVQAVFKLLHRCKNGLMTVFDEHMNGQCFSERCIAIRVHNQLDGCATLALHYKNRDSQRCYRTYSLDPRGPVASFEVMLKPKSCQPSNCRQPAHDQHVAAPHKFFKSFHKGIIA